MMDDIRTRRDVPAFIPFAFPGTPQVKALFSTTAAGNIGLAADTHDRSSVLDNRQRLMAQAGIVQWSELHQVHGDVLIPQPLATALDASDTLPQADGAATRARSLALLIKTADCQPLLLAHRSGEAIAALHVGWRGNVLNFPGSGVTRFCELYGFDPADVMAVRGPSLGPGAAEFVNFAREWPSEFRPWFDEQRKTMDLWSLTRDQLIGAGVRQEHIFALDLCTRSLPELFFSYRRGHTGRQASLIWIQDDSSLPHLSSNTAE